MAKKKKTAALVRERRVQRRQAKQKKIAVVLSVLGILVAVAALWYSGGNLYRAFRMSHASGNDQEIQQNAKDPGELAGWWWTEDGKAGFLLGEDRYYAAYETGEDGALRQICRVRYMLFEDRLVLDTDPDDDQNPTIVKCSYENGVLTLDGVAYRKGSAPEK